MMSNGRMSKMHGEYLMGVLTRQNVNMFSIKIKNGCKTYRYIESHKTIQSKKNKWIQERGEKREICKEIRKGGKREEEEERGK